MSLRNAFAALLLVAATSLHAAPRTVTIATAEGSTPGSAAKELAALMTHLNAGADLKFTLKTYPNYEAAYAAFKKREAELILFGSVKYVQAHSEVGALPVAVEEPKWQQSAIIVANDSPLKSVQELKGKKFAFGYEDSTTTRLLPLLLFSKYQMTPEQLGKSAFLGSDQNKIVDAVASGQYDAGAVAAIVHERHKTRVRVLESSERIPGGTVAAQKDLDPKLIEQVRAQFVSFKPGADAAGQRFAKGAAAAVDADYNKVRFLCKVLFKKTYL